MDMRRTLVPVEVKELGDRVLEIAGSTEDIDRMGDIIKSKGWLLKPFKKNPVFMWSHDYSQPPIGRALKVWVDKETKRLMFEVEFADAETYAFADTIYKLYKGGFLHATSVGFIPLDWEGKSEEEPNPKWEGNVFTKQELLELSAVPIPANANALVTARNQGLITVKEFEAVTKSDVLRLENIDAALEQLKAEGKDPRYITDKAKYTCECIDCGHTLETDKHCRDIKCPKCGGEMRRIERPGPGQESVTKPEETDDYIRIPVKGEEGKHTDHKIRTIDVDKKKGIKALYCVDCKIIITYLFDKDNDENWTLASAQAWVDEHSKTVNEWLVYCEEMYERHEIGKLYPAWLAGQLEEEPTEEPKPAASEVSQEQLHDDLDYIDKIITAVGLSEGIATDAVDVAIRIMGRAWAYHQWDSIILGEYLTGQEEPVIFVRCAGNDIPDEILTKVGAVLNAKNKGRLTQIQELAQAVLDSAAATDNGDKQLDLSEHTPTEAELTRQRALDVAEVTQVVIAQLKGKRLNK